MVKIGVFQMTSVLSLEENKSWILDQLKCHDLSSLRYLFFPENSLSFKINDDDNLQALDLKDPFLKVLINICKNNDLEMQISTPVTGPIGQTFNSSFWVTNSGIQSIYNKIHLFKVTLPSKVINENLLFEAGDLPIIHFSSEGIEFGSSICFDLRFPKLYKHYADKGVDVITVPSAFLERTGKDHWHVLLRARAIETQTYVVASAQSGTHVCKKTGFERKTFGHSLVVDPWGNVILDAGKEDGLYTCYLDIDFLKTARSIIPLEENFKG